ncbi:MAG: hypothetical protein GYB34_02760 [Gammaproteobacteria bacterium]|nr:hypothetical protein [Gammaproteobacteria bacterium]
MKNFFRPLTLAFIAISISACSSTDENSSTAYAKVNDEDDGMICKMEKKTGSNRMQRVCYSVEEREQMRETGKEGWLRLQRTSETGGG